LWGKPDRVHVQNMKQLNEYDCHQNLRPLNITKRIHVYMNCESGLATIMTNKACCTKACPAHAAGGDDMDR